MRKWKRTVRTAVAVCMACLLATQVSATSLEDAQQDKEEAEENKSREEEILASLESKKSDLETWVTELDGQLAELQTEINDLNQQKTELETEIAQKQTELEAAKEDEQQQYADMCARIQYMYENDDASYADALLSSKSMSDILNQSEYASAVSEYDYNMLEELVAAREQIANDEQMLELDLSSVENLTAQVEEEENTVNELIEAKSQEISEYNDLIEEQEEIIAACDAEIEAAASQIAAIEAAANSNGTFVPYSGGALTWPVPSSTRITSYFGGRNNPFGGSSSEFHPSIDIGAAGGSPIVAAASGVVVISKYSSSAGEWIVISHGNGLYTSYMHGTSGSRAVSQGDYVTAGQTIMLVGSTGRSTGNHLDFGVWVGWPGYGGYSSYAVDPLSYFQ